MGLCRSLTTREKSRLKRKRGGPGLLRAPPLGYRAFFGARRPPIANPGSLRRVCPDGPDGGITWQHLRVRNPDRFYRLVGSSREIVHVGTWQYAHMHFEKYPKVPISLGRLQSVDGGLETMEIVHEKIVKISLLLMCGIGVFATSASAGPSEEFGTRTTWIQPWSPN